MVNFLGSETIFIDCLRLSSIVEIATHPPKCLIWGEGYPNLYTKRDRTITMLMWDKKQGSQLPTAMLFFLFDWFLCLTKPCIWPYVKYVLACRYFWGMGTIGDAANRVCICIFLVFVVLEYCFFKLKTWCYSYET